LGTGQEKRPLIKEFGGKKKKKKESLGGGGRTTDAARPLNYKRVSGSGEVVPVRDRIPVVQPSFLPLPCNALSSCI